MKLGPACLTYLDLWMLLPSAYTLPHIYNYRHLESSWHTLIVARWRKLWQDDNDIHVHSNVCELNLLELLLKTALT